MTPKSGAERLRSYCRRESVQVLLEKYIRACHKQAEDDAEPSSTRKKRTPYARFPNLAGFCRYLQIGSRELAALAEEYPDQIDLVYLVLEDEALNAALAPALLSAYLKRRLGYERAFERSDKAEPSDPNENNENEEGEERALRICFEHDVYGDGE